MDINDATEQAYKNGYEDGKRDAVKHGRWIDGVCSNCKEEAISRSWDEPIYDYDWEENLRYSYTETHMEYQLTDYCPNCGADMKGENIMFEVCGDNRFEIIEKAKKDILDATNIGTSPDEMKVLDSFLFRCWQMGWLDKYEG